MPGKKKQSEVLSELAQKHEKDLWHTAEQQVFATIPIDSQSGKGHYENHAVKSAFYKGWLRRLYSKECQNKVPNSRAVNEAVDDRYGVGLLSRQEEVFVRLAQHADCICWDLANNAWDAVEISKRGWSIIGNPLQATPYLRLVRNTPPVKFRRPRGMGPIPIPCTDGNIIALRSYLNLPPGDEGEKYWRLIVAWLVQALRPNGPYPVLVLHGEQGSAKSTTSRLLKALIDPSKVSLKTMPRDTRDLAITANNGWVLVFDNVSGINQWLSDAFCRLSTGGGFSTRQLYTDEDEILFSTTRPLILNGIDEIVNRNDLADRCIFVRLPPIFDSDRCTERELFNDFERDRPAIMGGLLDAVVEALKNLPTTTLPKVPRMADFATWVHAAEPALPWGDGGFISAYTDNIQSAIDMAIDGDCVGSAIKNFMTDRLQWQGTPTELLHQLESAASGEVRLRSWPKSAVHLTRRLMRSSSFLRRTGIEVIRDRESDGRRIIALHKE